MASGIPAPTFNGLAAPPRGEARRLLMACALALALVTGGVVGQTWAVLAPVTPIVARNAAIARVRAWYAAANRLLATGDESSFAGILAPNFEDHTHSGAGDATSLISALLGLRAIHPNARLIPLDLAVTDDRVLARVQVDGAGGGSFLGLPVVNSHPWSTVDTFRLVPSGIAEHWSDDQPLASFTALATVSVPAMPSNPSLKLTRRIYRSGGTEVLAASGGIALVLVETGELRFTPDRLATGLTWLAGNAAGGRAEPPLADATTLEPGNTLLLGDGGMGRLRNDGVDDASALVLMIAAGENATLTSTGAGGPPGPERASSAANASLIVTEPLAGGAIDVPAGAVTVRIGRAEIPPGDLLAAHAVAGAEVIAVKSGELALSVADGKTSVSGSTELPAATVANTLLMPGNGALVSGRVQWADFRGAGEKQTTFLLMVITPDAPTTTSNSIQ